MLLNKSCSFLLFLLLVLTTAKGPKMAKAPTFRDLSTTSCVSCLSKPGNYWCSNDSSRNSGVCCDPEEDPACGDSSYACSNAAEFDSVSPYILCPTDSSTCGTQFLSGSSQNFGSLNLPSDSVCWYQIIPETEKSKTKVTFSLVLGHNTSAHFYGREAQNSRLEFLEILSSEDNGGSVSLAGKQEYWVLVLPEGQNASVVFAENSEESEGDNSASGVIKAFGIAALSCAAACCICACACITCCVCVKTMGEDAQVQGCEGGEYTSNNGGSSRPQSSQSSLFPPSAPIVQIEPESAENPSLSQDQTANNFLGSRQNVYQEEHDESERNSNENGILEKGEEAAPIPSSHRA